ncbi:hypothetical protein SLEP1_g34604 [Rubroshorea leprosula]|uniref:Single-stranded DNA-binding protein n=1 Tax=Rubroshorea leprosula TaxID=152421 RepID=A0AAV5KKJ3_9ROSI|nr:hypothetical protein SLEP1_g34604 [Rubroshorea leprosula]
MANSMATLSRRFYRHLLSNPRTAQCSIPFSTTLSSGGATDVDEVTLDEEAEPPQSQSSPPSASSENVKTGSGRPFKTQLENGLDTGIFKAILVGQVGNPPHQKKLKNGASLTFFTLGTGGVHNSRRPLQNEEPMEYANRCTVQWHRICVYPESLGQTVMKHLVPGSIVYLEGNLETKIFNDPITGLVRRFREVGVRKNGRLVLLDKNEDAKEAASSGNNAFGFY